MTTESKTGRFLILIVHTVASTACRHGSSPPEQTSSPKMAEALVSPGSRGMTKLDVAPRYRILSESAHAQACSCMWCVSLSNLGHMEYIKGFGGFANGIFFTTRNAGA